MKRNDMENTRSKARGFRTPSAIALPLAVVLLGTASVLGSPGRTFAQSLSKTAAAPVQSGTNSGSVDSLIGPHYWYFWAQPGHFQLTFSQTQAQGLAASGHASINCGFAPPTPGSHITYQITPEGAVFSGTVTQRTRVGIAVSPPNSPLIRSTVPYTVAASGDVVFDPAKSAGATVAGMYTMKAMPAGMSDPGAVRFNADGTIEAVNGQTGTWKLFDQESGTYVVVLAGHRMSLHFDPGRGFMDMQQGWVTFSRTH